MFEIIINWYKLYSSVWVFLFHKIIHIVTGLAIAFIASYGLHMPTLGMVLVLAVAIIKEVYDHITSFDEMSQSYQYDAPLSAHMLDVMVTVFGGIVGLVIGSFL